MDKGKRRLIELALTVTAALVVIVALLAMNNLRPSTPYTVPPGKGPGGNNTTVIPPPTTNPPPPTANPPPGGGGSSGGNNTTNLPPSGKIPPGWQHARCPTEVLELETAHGVRARCLSSMTYGAMKKAGLSNTANPETNPAGNPFGLGVVKASPQNNGVRAHGDPASKAN